MKRIILIALIILTPVIAGCGDTTPQNAYTEASKGCTMSGYELRQGSYDTVYFCKPIQTREDKFYSCTNNCDQAIDDIRDNVGEQSAVNECLKLCMGE